MTQSQTGHGDMARLPVRSPGLTLPELLISLSVTSIMVLAAQNFLAPLIHSSRMSGEVNRFVAALQLARSEAVKQGRPLVLCPQTQQHLCGRGADWKNGWLLFASDNREREGDEPLILAAPPLAGFIKMHSGNHRKRIVYQPDGSSGGTNSSFTFCDKRGLAKPRVICLSNSGRPRTTYTRCDGKPISC
ncbi:MAG: GspH/FimT family pseudopilin [Gammaproteobacteria bacterium]